MKTEKEIINELGEWLCNDMEKSLFKHISPKRPLSARYDKGIENIKDVSKRITFYRDHCLEQDEG